MAILEKVFVSLWILYVGIWRSWRCLVVVVHMVPQISSMITMGGTTSHPSWEIRGCRMAYLSSI